MAKVITIAQQKGGAGKTTIAAHLAVAIAQKGRRVALVDIDPQGSLTHWHELREERFGKGYTGLNFIHLSGWRVGTEVSRLRKTHDIVIIDSPPHTESEARAAIRNADLVIVPVQPSPTDLWATKATLDLAEHEGIKVTVVLNRVAPNARIAELIADKLDNLADSRLGNRVAFATALMEGRCVTETQPGSPAAREIKALAEDVWEMLGIDAEEAAEAELEDA